MEWFWTAGCLALIEFGIICIYSHEYNKLNQSYGEKIQECIRIKENERLGVSFDVYREKLEDIERLKAQNEELANYIKAIINRYTMKYDIIIDIRDIEKVKYAQLYKEKSLESRAYYLRVIFPENFIKSRKESR